jgi:hypothetical protein
VEYIPRMDEFSYLSVLISVILGLAVTQILKGFRKILLSRALIRIYWPVIAWAALLLLVCVQSWWAMFELRQYQPWTFAAFAVVLLQTILTYMLAGLKNRNFSSAQRWSSLRRRSCNIQASRQAV